MYIYSAKKGDTLASIARETGTTQQELMTLNQTVGNTLTEGINLLIPGKPSTLIHHTVGPRETLTTIARQYGVPVYAIYGANGLPSDAKLEIGQILFVPQPILTKKTIDANGYLIPSGTSEDAMIIHDATPLTYITIFSYHVNEAGDIVPMPDQEARDAIKKENEASLMCVTNFDGNNFNTDLAHAILSNPTLSNKVFIAMEEQLIAKGFQGVNVDFEHMQPTDRPLYNEFIRELHARMHSKGYSVSIAMGPKTSDEPHAAWMGAFDYRTLGSIVDFLMLMTYEWGWVGGPPMAIAPIDQVRAVLEYATSVIAPDKILMGFAMYGYNWQIPDTKNNLATGISPNKAQNVAIEKGANVRFNPFSASPMFHYYMGNQEHEVWYEDPKSILAKFHLVYEMNLRGISFWVLGQSFPQLWKLVADTFEVRHLV